MALLDTRDAELRLWHDGALLRSPGFVLLEEGSYQFGSAAVARAKLRPRDVNNRFWWQLGTQPLKPPLGPARHTADLVHAHLNHLHRESGSPQDLVLVVPDSMPRAQLSLLLGIAQACDFQASGLVSRSVLLGSAAGLGERPALHVELQLHQAVINELVPEGDSLVLGRSTPLPACGLLALQERCVSAIANAFIQQTRFDPRRRADTEQQLYDQLPETLSTLSERGECSLDVDGNHCRVLASTLDAATARLHEALEKALDGTSRPVLIDRSLQLLTGSRALPGEPQLLEDDALWEAYQLHAERIRSDDQALHLVDRLPLADGPVAPSPAPPTPRPAPAKASAASQSTRATHVLIGTRALPLRGESVALAGSYALQREGEHWTLSGDDALVNGLPCAPRQALHLGDTLSLGSEGHGRLIEVVD
jgi:hypothetical protein